MQTANSSAGGKNVVDMEIVYLPAGEQATARAKELIKEGFAPYYTPSFRDYNETTYYAQVFYKYAKAEPKKKKKETSHET